MKAYRIEDSANGPRGHLVELSLDDIDQGDVVVRTRFAGINYKDALAGTGKAPIIRRYPCVGGIEAVGQVETSTSDRFKPGDWVIAHGRGIGVSHDGGFAERVRVPADWLVHLPAGLSPREAAVLGVAGHSAALAVHKMEAAGLTPESGPVAVTGATGGVGSLAVAMLAKRGFTVTAVTSKTDRDGFLRGLGAADVRQPPQEPSRKPLEAAEWAGADTAGGPQLEWLLRSAAAQGIVTSIGNAAGIGLTTTVLPFILRGVTLIGINSDTPMTLRQTIWDRLAGDLKPADLDGLGREIALEVLPAYMDEMIASKIQGRTLVAFAE